MATSLPQLDPNAVQRLYRLQKAPAAPTTGPGMLSPGNIDVYDRPIVPNGKDTSTLFSTSFGNDKGEVLVPRVSDGADGKAPHIMSGPEAWQYYRDTKQNLGTFDTPAHATAFGQSLHNQQASMQNVGGRTQLPPQILSDPLQPPPLQRIGMPSANPLASMPASTLPNVSMARDPAVQGIQDNVLRNIGDLKRLQTQGSGTDQIFHPLDASGNPTTQSPGLLRRLGGIAAKIGDIAYSSYMPAAAALTPGTTEHHRYLMNQDQARINSGLANEQSQAQTTLLDAQPQLKMMGLENAQLRNQAYSQHVADQGEHYGNQDTNHLRDTGYTQDETDPTGQKIRPLRYEEMSEKQQATEDLKHAQTEQAEATAAMKKAQNDPTSPAFKLAKQRADAAQFNANTARQRLGLSQAQYNMHAYGTDASGQNELPGILHDEAGRGVGSVQAANVRPTTMSRDAASRADSMVDIGDRLRAGLADPEIQSYLGPLRGRVSSAQGDAGMLPEKVAKFRNDLVSYGAFQAGLHPVRGIGALQYFDHVMGGLGQTPESLLGKLNSNDETAADVQKVGAMPTTAGIARAGTAPHGPINRGGVQTFKDGNTTYHIPANQVTEFKKDHPNAR